MFESAHSEEYYCSGCWSLTRPAVFFLGKDNGSIEVWNLLEDSLKPLQVHESISKNRITSIKPWTVSCKYLCLVFFLFRFTFTGNLNELQFKKLSNSQTWL